MEKLEQTSARERITSAAIFAGTVLLGATVITAGLVLGYETGVIADWLPDMVNQPAFDPSVLNQ